MKCGLAWMSLWSWSVLLLGSLASCADDEPATGDGDTDAGIELDLGPDTSAEDPIEEIDDRAQDGLEDDSAEPDALDASDEESEQGEGIILRLYNLDIWGEPLEEPQLTVRRFSTPVLVSDQPIAQVRLVQPGSYTVLLSAPHHHPLALEMVYNGSGRLDGLAIDGEPLRDFHGLTVGRREQVIHGVPERVVTLFLGLRHRWFSASGRPGRHGNQVQLLMDGEEAWRTVYERLEEADDRVHVTVWWWESDFELLRPWETHMTMTDEERQANTIDAILDRLPVVSRILVWQDNLAPWVTVDQTLVARGQRPGDNFEFMGMSNPTQGVFWWEIEPFYFSDRVTSKWPEASTTELDDEEPIASTIAGHEVDLTDYPLGLEVDVQIASWHQKFLVIDGDEAFIGGMNMKAVDWDSSQHRVFDPRRMAFEATSRDRIEVVQRLRQPDFIPRKDYMVHLVGPVVEDAEEVFHSRWLHQIETGREFSENASAYYVYRDQEPLPGGIEVQVTTTMPAPFNEGSNLESMVNAVMNAERYIFVEDQYWRAPLLAEAIIDRMAEVPDLLLVVLTNPVDEWFDPACEWTCRTDQDIRRYFGNRYFLFQAKSFDTAPATGSNLTEGVFVDMDLHSKLLMVDDVFLNVGSCNKNNRGFIYEGEMNVSILDEDFVHEARHRILANWMGHETGSDDPSDWLDELRQAAWHNDDAYRLWDKSGFDLPLGGAPLPDEYRPRGFLYSLGFPDPGDCFIEGIGPDIM